MAENTGTTDRLLRILAAVVIALLYFTGHVSGPAAVALGIVALMFVVSSAVGFCPSDAPFAITAGADSSSEKNSHGHAATERSRPS